MKVGIDIVEVKRFERFEKNKNSAFLKKVFHKYEIMYSFSFKKPAVHLAGLFALKEATSKALGTDTYPYIEIEVFHEKNGAPYVCHKGKRLSVAVSISHTDMLATAIAIEPSL